VGFVLDFGSMISKLIHLIRSNKIFQEINLSNKTKKVFFSGENKFSHQRKTLFQKKPFKTRAEFTKKRKEKIFSKIKILSSSIFLQSFKIKQPNFHKITLEKWDI